MTEKTLRQLYIEHEGKVSDKWGLYLSEYDRLLSIYRKKAITFFEIGVQNGGSLEIWSKYFPLATQLVGCDINQLCSKLKYENPRISLVIGDANLDVTESEVLSHSSSFDIIIDDGSHLSGDIINSFSRYFPVLNENGIFIAEDLHCSYWKEYEGGVYNPFSSIAFFKRLADIVNYEHWGINCKREVLLESFNKQYGCQFTEELLSTIHSVEFINSICVVRKEKAQNNILEARVIAGTEELVVPGHFSLETLSCEPLDQEGDEPFSEFMPIEEKINIVEHENDILKQHNAALTVIKENHERVLNSFSWRITMPIRLAKRFVSYALINWKYILKQLLAVSGWRKLFNKIKVFFRNLIYKISYQFEKKIRAKKTIESRSAIKLTRGRIIVVSHNANKEGAPLLALNIVKNLRDYFSFEVVTILASGGELIPEFKKISKVYRFDLLSNKERNELFADLHGYGFDLALCNTSVVGDIVESLKQNNIKCISLIHELPYVVKIAKLEQSFEKILNNSDLLVFPAEYVKNKLGEKFSVDDKRSRVRNQGRYMGNPYIFKKKDAKRDLRKHLNCSSETKIILNIGSGEYRKGLDLFVDTGIELAKTYKNILFVWVGVCKPEDMTAAKSKIKKAKANDFFKFIGFEKEIGLFYSGADVFFLSSREDPFPSVYIDAVSAGLPVVAFSDSGGFVETQKEISGSLIDDYDTNAVACEIHDLLVDEKKYTTQAAASLKASEKFGFNRYLYDLLDMSGISLPKVSVIVPNYNYEKYIVDRLQSIFLQTVKPYEIIFLDDNSTDDSLEIAKIMLEQSGFDYRVIANTENKGCYQQWLHGVSLSQGDIVWIAEADDLCKPDFLEKLLPRFDDCNTSLVYSQSIAIDEKSREMNFSYLDYTRELSETRWENDFTNTGESEITDYLVKLNTIPNASGVLMRKSALNGMDDLLKQFTSTGDWFVYVYALKKGNISFVSEPLNYHRRHGNSIIHSVMHDPRLLKEIVLVSKYILSNYEISKESQLLLANRFNEYYSLIPNNVTTLSMDKEFEKFFIENGVEDLWEYVKSR